jgi:hypothetical protein
MPRLFALVLLLLTSEIVLGFEKCSINDPDFSHIRRYPKGSVEYCRRNVSRSTRMAIYEKCGVSDTYNYTMDHRIPLFVGGNNSIRNLCPQLKSESTARFEGDLFRSLERGEITPDQVLDAIRERKGECWCDFNLQSHRLSSEKAKAVCLD